jgi:hypothetical protein
MSAPSRRNPNRPTRLISLVVLIKQYPYVPSRELGCPTHGTCPLPEDLEPGGDVTLHSMVVPHGLIEKEALVACSILGRVMTLLSSSRLHTYAAPFLLKSEPTRQVWLGSN